MFESHFGMKHRPFRSAPDTQRYYPAAGHEQVLARLLQAMRDEQGIAVLSGASGTGKTLLCHCLLERIESPGIFLTNSHFADRAALLQAILYDLGQPYQGKSEQELRLALTEELLKTFAEGNYTLLIIDEAQNLSAELFEEVRLLSNLEARQGKAVQVLLVGQPELLAMLRLPEMDKLRQRVAVWAVLDPLPTDEAVDYLNAQLRLAGARPEKLMTAEALAVLAEHGRGIPRVLNHVAHEALSLAAGAGAEQVDVEAALEAVAMLGMDDPSALQQVAEALEDKAVPHSPVEAELLRRLFPTEQHV